MTRVSTVNRRPLLLVVYWDTVYTYFNIFYLIERKKYYIIYLNVTRLCVTQCNMKYLHISIYIFIMVLILYQIVKDSKMQTLITQIYKIWPILRSTGTISEGVVWCGSLQIASYHLRTSYLIYLKIQSSSYHSFTSEK